MKVTIDTKEDTHEEIRKAIRMLQHIIGDDQNQSQMSPAVAEQSQSPIELFSNMAASQEVQQESQIISDPSTIVAATSASESQSSATDDLFAELFSEEEIKKMDTAKEPEEELPKQSKSPYKIEIY